MVPQTDCRATKGQSLLNALRRDPHDVKKTFKKKVPQLVSVN